MCFLLFMGFPTSRKKYSTCVCTHQYTDVRKYDLIFLPGMRRTTALPPPFTVRLEMQATWFPNDGAGIKNEVYLLPARHREPFM